MKNWALFMLLIFGQNAFAQIKLPSLVSNGMILQRDQATTLWGWAGPGEKIRVQLGKKTIRTQADAQGNWQTQLPAYPAGGPHTLKLSGKNEIVLEDVLFGDVWLCSGQSNMVLEMERVKEKYPEEIANANFPQIRNFFIPTANSKIDEKTDLPPSRWMPTNPRNVLKMGAVTFFFARDLYQKYQIPIGIINSSVGGSPIESWLSLEALKSFPNYSQDTTIAKPYSPVKKTETDRGLTESPRWFEANYTPQGWKNYAIPGFWEDQGLRDLNGVVWFRKEITLTETQAMQPAKLFMGRIIDADEMYVNGARIGNINYQYPPRRYEIPPGTLKPGTNIFVSRVINTAGKGGFFPDKRYELVLGNQTIELQGTWQYKVGDVFEKPAAASISPYTPTGLYNGMIAPLTPFRLKGILWYQGESNAGRASEYQEQLVALAADWRKSFQQANLPFIYAQLPGFGDLTFLPTESNWAELREGQREAQAKIPNSQMVVTIDLGEWNDIHPLTKKPIGERMALAATRIAYGEKTKLTAGPTFERSEIQGNKIRVSFQNIGTGLAIEKTAENTLQYFEIAGSNKQFVRAQASIENNTVVVWSDRITEPRYVRYAWSNNPEGANLINQEGLPASPFQTR
jgi:sialate O-acetylesterase